ncbi:MAG: hypothetical protein EOP84_07595 [Verrucomicrobiaceae bacterium]|nr:MAG: hypothetical protein EOP84_07595 [Verrucomicrobiaceae bacterium]
MSQAFIVQYSHFLVGFHYEQLRDEVDLWCGPCVWSYFGKKPGDASPYENHCIFVNDYFAFEIEVRPFDCLFGFRRFSNGAKIIHFYLGMLKFKAGLLTPRKNGWRPNVTPVPYLIDLRRT